MHNLGIDDVMMIAAMVRDTKAARLNLRWDIH